MTGWSREDKEPQDWLDWEGQRTAGMTGVERRRNCRTGWSTEDRTGGSREEKLQDWLE